MNELKEAIERYDNTKAAPDAGIAILDLDERFENDHIFCVYILGHLLDITKSNNPITTTTNSKENYEN